MFKTLKPMVATFPSLGNKLTQLEFARRRAAFGDRIGNGMAVFASAPVAVNHNDVEYLYRQDSDFYYLTGFNEPEAIAVLIPGHTQHQYILFVRPRDLEAETWTGPRAGVEGAVADYGADVAYPISEFSERMLPYLKQANSLYYSLGNNQSVNQQVLDLWQRFMASYPRHGMGVMTLTDAKIALAQLRVIKSTAELEQIRAAIAISAVAHEQVRQLCQPGMYEYELAAELELQFRRRGGMGCAYPSIVAAGANACILHYVENNAQIQAADLVLIDAGCCYDYYNADITRTFPANGRFSPEQKALYEVVLAAQKQAIAAVKPGNPYNAPHQAAVEVVIRGLHELGLLTGELEELLEEGLQETDDPKVEQAKRFKQFFMHRTGHYLGMDVHDVGNYKIEQKWSKLQPGMVITIEPGIYVSPRLQVNDRWQGIGIRIEDDLLVTDRGHEVLTAAVPKEVNQLEI
ncbi:MAG: aminopeptidase P N-terminal domain-containing protein [Pseudanabaenaceae cyanobacterium bins.68]|nr:aminopeptidase P N-terminal domain-containing protein [Pseudanabaenaceae cyanobacterium bins.68]